MAISNTVTQTVVFRFKSLNGERLPMSLCSPLLLTIQCTLLVTQSECLVLGGEPQTESSEDSEVSLFKHVMRSRTTHSIAFFISAHLGVAAALGGWIVTYIVRVRGGGPSAGYISAGVSGGLSHIQLLGESTQSPCRCDAGSSGSP